jgi:hypothetical protein
MQSCERSSVARPLARLVIGTDRALTVRRNRGLYAPCGRRPHPSLRMATGPGADGQSRTLHHLVNADLPSGGRVMVAGRGPLAATFIVGHRSTQRPTNRSHDQTAFEPERPRTTSEQARSPLRSRSNVKRTLFITCSISVVADLCRVAMVARSSARGEHLVMAGDAVQRSPSEQKVKRVQLSNHLRPRPIRSIRQRRREEHPIQRSRVASADWWPSTDHPGHARGDTIPRSSHTLPSEGSAPT